MRAFKCKNHVCMTNTAFHSYHTTEKSFFFAYVRLQLACFQRGRVVCAFSGFAARPSLSLTVSFAGYRTIFTHRVQTVLFVTSATNESFVDFLPIVSYTHLPLKNCRIRKVYLLKSLRVECRACAEKYSNQARKSFWYQAALSFSSVRNLCDCGDHTTLHCRLMKRESLQVIRTRIIEHSNVMNFRKKLLPQL